MIIEKIIVNDLNKIVYYTIDDINKIVSFDNCSDDFIYNWLGDRMIEKMEGEIE